ncbi:MAG: nitroreductase family protein [Planctomycetes bacterium]|nr:nitroreductase family protein [Planctomycetota bacterium]MCB9910774.1 nitroreductase family protein [Planctomycetota bacterium]MCB9912800.1 nitroreductase family protein [Planctomycetota bacterium]HPF13182.1 nitroreductase family protein [Planctomycetota bacterium]HRV80568.1 nitroreductase family protein [Planctomycetota bacterium]
MDTIEAIRQRRSVKKYDPNHRMSEDEIRQLFETVRLSPTSFNLQNWRFVVATDPALRLAMREAAWGQAQFSEASLLVLLVMDLKAHEREPMRYWANADEKVREMLVGMIGRFYGDNPKLARDEGLRSCGIAGQTLMLAAKAMGYDSCPMVGFDFGKMAELIQLPADHEIAFAISVGKALEPARPRGSQLPYEEIVHRDRFPG